MIKQTKIDSNQIYCTCLDINYLYFYILHIVGEIVVVSFGSAVACFGCCVDENFAELDLIVAVVVTMQWGIDVTSSLCQLTDDILSFDNRNPDLTLRQHVNLAEDSAHYSLHIDSSHTF